MTPYARFAAPQRGHFHFHLNRKDASDTMRHERNMHYRHIVFSSEHPAEWDWIVANAHTKPYAALLRMNIQSRGSLNDREMHVIHRSLNPQLQHTTERNDPK